MEDYQKNQSTPKKKGETPNPNANRYPKSTQKVTNMMDLERLLQNRDGFNKNKAELIIMPVDLEMTNAYFFDKKNNYVSFKERLERVLTN